MRGVLKLLPVLLLGLLAAAWGFGRTLPDSYTITSELEMNASASKVYRFVHDAEGWKRWFTGPEADVRIESSDRMVLVHDDVEHTLELTHTSSPTRVAYAHYAEATKRDPVRGRLDIEPRGDSVRVRLREVVEVDSSTQRWLIYLFGADLMTQVLDRELHNLKSLVETGEVRLREYGADGG